MKEENIFISYKTTSKSCNRKKGELALLKFLNMQQLLLIPKETMKCSFELNVIDRIHFSVQVRQLIIDLLVVAMSIIPH